MHVTPEDIRRNWQKYAEREPYFGLLSGSPGNRFASVEGAAAELEKSGFDRGVVFGFAFRDPGLCRYVNDYVIEGVKRFPQLIGFISVVPGSPEAEGEIDRCFQGGLRGIGELYPAGQGFRIEEAGETGDFVGACRERNLPVILHVNEPVGHAYRGKTETTLRQVEQFIEHSPGLRIILAHWGGGLPFYEAMPEMREKCREVYYDTAASVFLYDSRIYRAAGALGLREKIVFGSDFPLLSPSRYLPGIKESGIAQEDVTLLLGGNGERVLNPGLEGQEMGNRGAD